MTPLEKQVMRELRARLRLAGEKIRALEIELADAISERNLAERRRKELARLGKERSLRWRMERHEYQRQLARRERKPGAIKRCEWCGRPAFGAACAEHIGLMGTADMLEEALA